MVIILLIRLLSTSGNDHRATVVVTLRMLLLLLVLLHFPVFVFLLIHNLWQFLSLTWWISQIYQVGVGEYFFDSQSIFWIQCEHFLEQLTSLLIIHIVLV